MNLADIGRDGRVLFQSNISRREIVAVSGQDGVERNLTWFDWSFPIDLARDGKTLLFMEQNIQPPGVYLRKLDGSPAVRLGDGYTFALSPDGRSALSSRDPAKGQMSLLPTGPGEPQDLSPTGINLQAVTWIPNANRILISGNEPGRRSRLWVQDVPSGKPRAITPEGVSFAFSRTSPDGKWVVALGPDRRYGLYPLEPGEPRPLPGLDPEEVPVQWSPDGRAVAVYRPGGGAPARRALRRGDGRPEAVEGDSTSRSLRRRPGRADPHFLGRRVPTSIPIAAASTISISRRDCVESRSRRPAGVGDGLGLLHLAVAASARRGAGRDQDVGPAVAQPNDPRVLGDGHRLAEILLRVARQRVPERRRRRGSWARCFPTKRSGRTGDRATP